MLHKCTWKTLTKCKEREFFTINLTDKHRSRTVMATCQSKVFSAKLGLLFKEKKRVDTVGRFTVVKALIFIFFSILWIDKFWDFRFFLSVLHLDLFPKLCKFSGLQHFWK